ncbi:unnamed protein product [Lactuca virosa]|uniref:Uncharacterized protein n=1 Tax=Lactuca virosa TaxID=75947 RepID=A0AAU9M213_9ASTR|nr:unnamed protein product [Lactuca virosa]
MKPKKRSPNLQCTVFDSLKRIQKLGKETNLLRFCNPFRRSALMKLQCRSIGGCIDFTVKSSRSFVGGVSNLFLVSQVSSNLTTNEKRSLLPPFLINLPLLLLFPPPTSMYLMSPNNTSGS